MAAATLFTQADDPRPQQTARNCRKLLVARGTLGGRPLPRSFARRLLTAARARRRWTSGSMPCPAGRTTPRAAMAGGRAAPRASNPSRPMRAGTRAAHVRAHGAEGVRGRLLERDGHALGQADSRTGTMPTASATRPPDGRSKHDRRDLETAGRLPARVPHPGDHGRRDAGPCWPGTCRFTGAPTSPSPGRTAGCRNQGAEPRERDLIVDHPRPRSRSRAVIMADHYDTAYMEDRYRENTTRSGPRLAAPGADDNGSATAAPAAGRPLPARAEPRRPARLRRLARPPDRARSSPPTAWVPATWPSAWSKGHWRSACPAAGRHDLSGVAGRRRLRPRHGGPRQPTPPGRLPDRSRRQSRVVSPGAGGPHGQRSLERRRPRAGIDTRPAAAPARRRAAAAPTALPPIARHPLLHGEVRPHDDPRSTLFNTDGQIFSDAGIPVVLFMEDYDIDRTGYHDSRDTMAGIDLDFGAALVAIAIEAVARAARAVANPEVLPARPVLLR